ncbi:MULTISPECIES: ATP-binding cassette domain-containing protein [Bradyrhizobium]|uniref:ATP-binding cassette domain-containing protein n=1 Tax=Bradyrhizobium elkanii TaxID=29448 RepID=A0A4U6S6D7_BRAEL|nr:MULTISPECIES: ATP-binding cassette domain-containing protein [Bradyrhizobium]MTV18948.1 ATP-binding cassette domain-containing protein [Bradyrhizobium sp. BR2003]TKV83319.1 ATP-binding cassette domain-containing protein [Bradyrhizobium elkanii]
MTRPILEAKRLHVSFNGVKAADDVSIAVNEGEFLAIIGPNGAGKTTLLNICTGYIRPRSGSVLLDGHDITRLSPRAIARRGVARAFQIPQLFSAQRVIDNMMLALAATEGLWSAVQPLETATRRDEAMALLDLVGLAKDADRIGSTLPEGHRKLLDIAVALALKPRLLLLDEPTSGVSALERFPLMEALMGALHQRRITALFVEHDMDVVARYASRVLVWNAGNIMAEGRPDEVFSNAQVRQRVVGVA